MPVPSERSRRLDPAACSSGPRSSCSQPRPDGSSTPHAGECIPLEQLAPTRSTGGRRGGRCSGRPTASDRVLAQRRASISFAFRTAARFRRRWCSQTRKVVVVDQVVAPAAAGVRPWADFVGGRGARCAALRLRLHLLAPRRGRRGAGLRGRKIAHGSGGACGAIAAPPSPIVKTGEAASAWSARAAEEWYARSGVQRAPRSGAHGALQRPRASVTNARVGPPTNYPPGPS